MRVLVTRPAHQADVLCGLIERHGGVAVRLPVIEILPPADPSPLAHIGERLATFDIAVFVSPNAVARALSALRLPAALQVIAVGGGTAKALRDHGIDAAVTPDQADSEGLLRLPVLTTVAGKRVVIFRGEGGRALLGETLKARGATVEYVECYRRAKPRTTDRQVLDRIAAGGIDAVTITTGEGLRNLYDMLQDHGTAALARLPLVVTSERHRETALQLGHTGPIVVAHTTADDAIVDALATCGRSRNPL